MADILPLLEEIAAIGRIGLTYAYDRCTWRVRASSLPRTCSAPGIIERRLTSAAKPGDGGMR